MNGSRYQTAVALFERIAALPPGAREGPLAEARAEDPELAAWVQRMLDADDEDWQPPDVVEQLAVGLLDDPLAPGAEVGGFVLEARLGSGGMAAVWRAAQERPQRRVALKILHPWLRAPLLLDRFRFEGDALARVRHPAFPEIFASGEQDGRPWIAMELVEGATLREWLAAEVPAPEARLGVLIALVEAVAALHRLGLVHRDLTPANVLIDRSGAPRVVDLGVAVDGDDDELVRRMAVGTPGWASPEQGGDALATPSSDVYALGALGRMLVLGARGAAAGPLDDVSAILERASSPRAAD